LGRKEEPFSELISKSKEFIFDENVIDNIRSQMKTLLRRLSTLYTSWDKASQAQATQRKEERKRKRILVEGTTEGKTAQEAIDVDGCAKVLKE
jgi:hypothetical protein